MPTPDTQGVILEVASRLFASRGYDAVSMRDVATEVGSTPANLYYHFKDKEHLIRATLAHVFSQRTAALEEILLSGHRPSDRLTIFVEWFGNLLFSDSVFARLLLRELLDGDSARLKYLSETVFERPFALITRVVAGYSTPTDPVLFAVSVIGLVLGHFQLASILPHLPGGHAEFADPATVSRHTLELLRRTLQAGPHEPHTPPAANRQAHPRLRTNAGKPSPT
jgi:AcrR family transcriptional regulator